VKRPIQNTLLLLHFSLFMMLIGVAMYETFINFPNWFAEIPASLARASAFLSVRHPGMFFQTAAPLTIVTGILFVLVGWRTGAPRNFVLTGVLLLVGLELVTFNLVYPKLRILLGRGDAAGVVYPVAQLEQTAREFLTLNGWRLGVMLLAALMAALAVAKSMSVSRKVDA
jgi:hypothetical protein